MAALRSRAQTPHRCRRHRSLKVDSITKKFVPKANYNSNDQLVEYNAAGTVVTASHDPNGNMTRLGAVVYGYDADDRLTRVLTPQTDESYRYDGTGNRVQASSTNRTLGTTTDTHYRWDGNFSVPQVVAQGPSAAVPTRLNVYGNGRIETLAGTVPTYYLTDGLGSVTSATDANHVLYRNYTYEPFGAVRSSQGSIGAPQTQYGFTGEQLNPKTNLYHLRARDLNPSTGRFLTTDPLPDAFGAPRRSPYLYANNQPTFLVDPLGLRASCGGGLRQGIVDYSATVLDNLTFGFTGGHEGVCVNPNGPGASAARGTIALTTFLAPVTAASSSTAVRGSVRLFDDAVPAPRATSPTYNDLRSAGQADAHHIIQDAAVRDVPGYSRGQAPAIQLGGPSTLPGSPHYNATQAQRAATGGGTYGAERQIGACSLAAAGCSPAQIAAALDRADAYFVDQLGLTLGSPLRVPGNRGRP